jgi:type III secretory pathway component EscR
MHVGLEQLHFGTSHVPFLRIFKCYGDALGVQALLAGQAVAGLAVSLTAFITLWVAPPFSGVPSPQHVSAPAATYFLSATVVTAACAAAYLALWQIPFAVHCWETDGTSYALCRVGWP